MQEFIFSILISYLLGSINPAYIIGKLRGIDLRTKGDKNLGTKNTYYILGLIPAIIVFIIDFMKGYLPFAIAQNKFLLPEIQVYIASFFVILGHRYPFYLNFKGGKGVAAGIGIFVAALLSIKELNYGIYFLIILVLLEIFRKYIKKE